jgi:hypothetical protein
LEGLRPERARRRPQKLRTSKNPQRLQALSSLLGLEAYMADDLKNRGQPDRSKINMHEAFEVKYWTKHLGVSKDELAAAINKVGNSAAAVMKQLGTD